MSLVNFCFYQEKVLRHEFLEADIFELQKKDYFQDL